MSKNKSNPNPTVVELPLDNLGAVESWLPEVEEWAKTANLTVVTRFRDKALQLILQSRNTDASRMLAPVFKIAQQRNANRGRRRVQEVVTRQFKVVPSIRPDSGDNADSEGSNKLLSFHELSKLEMNTPKDLRNFMDKMVESGRWEVQGREVLVPTDIGDTGVEPGINQRQNEAMLSAWLQKCDELNYRNIYARATKLKAQEIASTPLKEKPVFEQQVVEPVGLFTEEQWEKMNAPGLADRAEGINSKTSLYEFNFEMTLRSRWILTEKGNLEPTAEGNDEPSNNKVLNKKLLKIWLKKAEEYLPTTDQLMKELQEIGTYREMFGFHGTMCQLGRWQDGEDKFHPIAVHHKFGPKHKAWAKNKKENRELLAAWNERLEMYFSRSVEADKEYMEKEAAKEKIITDKKQKKVDAGKAREESLEKTAQPYQIGEAKITVGYYTSAKGNQVYQVTAVEGKSDIKVGIAAQLKHLPAVLREVIDPELAAKLDQRSGVRSILEQYIPANNRGDAQEGDGEERVA